MEGDFYACRKELQLEELFIASWARRFNSKLSAKTLSFLLSKTYATLVSYPIHFVPFYYSVDPPALST